MIIIKTRVVLTIIITIGMIQNSESKQIKRQTNLEVLNLQLLDVILIMKLYK
jgi:hypothetical protein